jgi:hypothetical protein
LRVVESHLESCWRVTWRVLRASALDLFENFVESFIFELADFFFTQTSFDTLRFVYYSIYVNNDAECNFESVTCGSKVTHFEKCIC